MAKRKAKKHKPESKQQKIVRKSRFSLEVVEYEDGSKSKRVICNDFNQHEIIGLLTIELRDILKIETEQQYLDSNL